MSLNKSAYFNCLYYSSGALARVMNKLAEEAFAPCGLAPSHAFLLMTVNADPGIQMGDMGRIMMLKPSTVSRLADKMERQGFIRRVSNGRRVEVFPSERARKLNELIIKCWEQLFANYSKVLGIETSTKLANLLYEATADLSA